MWRIVLAEEIQRMQQYGRLGTRPAAQPQGGVEIPQGQRRRKRAQVQEVAHVDRHFENRHCGHWDLGEGPNVQLPLIWSNGSYAVPQRAKEGLPSLPFFSTEARACMHKIV